MDIIPLAQVNQSMLELVGSKAFSLAQLKQDKFEVPETFIVSSQAFQRFLEQNDLLTLIESEIGNVNVEDYHSVDYASRLLHDAILSGRFSEEVEMEIMQQYKHINTELVAVRSSVFSDDPHSLPWSGKLATFLRVGPEDLLVKIRQCWASLFQSDALYQIVRKELNPSEIHIAVIVQRMIDSKVTGICYSQHPINHNEHQLVIEAGIGLGNPTEDRIYSPDTYIVDRARMKIEEKMIKKQEVSVMPDDGRGTILQDLDTKKAEQQKLKDKEIKQLAEEIVKIEALFQAPVAVEWLLEDQFYFLQVRVDLPHEE